MFGQLVNAGLGQMHAPCTPSNWNGLVTTPTVRMPLSRAARAMTGAAAGARAAAHAGGDEHHVGVFDLAQDIVERLLGGGAPHVGPGARAEALGSAASELDAVLAERQLDRLGVGVGDQEVDSFDVRLDHVVDGVAAGATHPDHGDLR